jgi:uncharacterized protein (TIGR03437 family)
VAVNPTTRTLAAGASDTVTVSLTGIRPNAGSYEGVIQATVGSATYRIPYQYLVTTGVMDSAYAVRGGFVAGTGATFWLIALKAIDPYCIPILNQPVQWNAICSNGAIRSWQTGGCPDALGGGFTHDSSNVYYLDDKTTNNGIAGALVNLGSTIGDQLFQAVIGSQTLTFYPYARGYQTINAGGVVDAATNQAFQNGLAPGSYISIYGNFLSPSNQKVSTPALPYGLSETSVGFYAANDRFPGRIHFVSPTQINVQIPWELLGQSSAQMVVRVGWEPSAAYNLALGTFTPGVFSNGTAILDWPTNQPVSASNPAKRGQAIQLFVNGLGPVDGPIATGELSPTADQGLLNTTNRPTVTIGGKNADVGFSGMAPGYVGLYQINVVVPNDAPTGTQKMTISVGGVPSKATDLPVQ